MRVRMAGLLARLAAHPGAASSMRNGHAFEALASALQRNDGLSGSCHADTPQWVCEEREQLVSAC